MDDQIEEILDRIDQIEFQQRLMIEKLTVLVEKFGKHINNVEKVLAENKKGPWLKLLKRKSNLRVAINQSIQDWTKKISDGDEIAFLPPITGG